MGLVVEWVSVSLDLENIEEDEGEVIRIWIRILVGEWVYYILFCNIWVVVR